MCKPTKLANLAVFPERQNQPRAGRRTAHNVKPGTTVDCFCGKRWRVTQNHLPNGGCGCGWELLDG